MRIRHLGICTLLALLVSASPASAATVNVTATSNVFTPKHVAVNVGDTVTWTNGGGVHNVHFDDGSFDMPATPASPPWSVSNTFGTVGTYRYYCEVHGGPNGAGMSGTVAANVGYPRPKGATPLYASLAPAYKPCTTPNRTHGPALSSPSCNPPAQVSDWLTVGSPDNAVPNPANSVGSVRLGVIPGDPGTPLVPIDPNGPGPTDPELLGPPVLVPESSAVVLTSAGALSFMIRAFLARKRRG